MTVPLVVDTREQLPYEFPGISHIVERQLDVGDYTYDGFEHVFVVERKSLDDLASCMGSDRDRFEAEIRRAQALREFVVVIEASKPDVYDWAHTKFCPNYYSKVYPKTITSTVEQWPLKYDTLEFVWAGDREGGMQETLYHLDKWYLEYRDFRE